MNQNKDQKIMNKYITETVKKFVDKTVFNDGRIILFSKDIVFQIINYCKEHNIKILELEGFYIYDINSAQPTIQPDMEYDIVFHNETIENSYKKSIEFLKTVKENLFFEVKTDEPLIEY